MTAAKIAGYLKWNLKLENPVFQVVGKVMVLGLGWGGGYIFYRNN